MSNYRTADYTFTYEARRGGGAGWVVWRNDGRVLGDYATEDAAKSDIPGFQHQDYLTQIQRWTHAQAHGVDLADSPLCLREPSNAPG